MAGRIAVTGASGMLGTALAVEASRRGFEVVGLHHRSRPSAVGMKWESLEIRSLESTRETLTRISPELILHAAADVRVDWCEDNVEEATLTNVIGSRNVATVATEIHANLLYVSTDSIFDGARGNYEESDNPAPVNVYAKTKLAGEEEVLRYTPNAIIARTNFYSLGGEHKLGLLGWILRELSNNRPVSGFTDTIFNPVPANEVAAAMVDLCCQRASGIFHVVGPKPISKYAFARLVAGVFGYDPALVTEAKLADAKLRAPRPLNTSLNTNKLQSQLGRKLPEVLEGLKQLARDAQP